MAKSILSAVSTAALLSSAAAFVPQTTHRQNYPGQLVMVGGGDVAQRMDPILAPGTISQHVHQFIGAGNLNSASDFASLQDTNCTTVGSADGSGNLVDRSAYWHPALYMKSADESEYIRVPNNMHKLYYKDAGNPKDLIVDPFEFPQGFRMLAGNPFMRAPNPIKAMQNITQWICHRPDAPDTPAGKNNWVYGSAGGFPADIGDEGCADFPYFNGALHFPHCWNGDDFNIAAPMAHMAYPDDDFQNGACPSSHPYRLPHIFMEIGFAFDKVASIIKNGTFTLAQGDPTGYGHHADFLSGWKPGSLSSLFEGCAATKALFDVSDCNGYQRFDTKASQCHIEIEYDEEVDRPGKYLPGCNPVVYTNPAPILAIAPLNVSTLVCGLADHGDDQVIAYSSVPAGSSPSASPSSSVAAAAAYSPPASSAPAYSAPSATTSPEATSETASSSDVPSTPSVSSAAPVATSAPAAPSSTSLKCPAADGQQYTASNGKVFQVECGIDHVAGNLDMVYSKNFAGCIEACASHDACVDVSLSGTACWMKQSLGKSVQRGEVSGAKLVTGASSDSADSSVAGSSTTELITTTTVVPTQTAGPYGGETVWVTEVVTVTALHSVYARQPLEEEVRAHMHKHAKYHVGRRAF